MPEPLNDCVLEHDMKQSDQPMTPTLQATEKPPEVIVPTPPKADDRAGFYKLAWLVLVIGALYFAKAVLVPLALAILLTFALVPLVKRLERLRLSRVAAVLAIILFGILLTCSLGWMFERQFTELAAKWPEYRVNIQTKIRNIARWSDKLEGLRTEVGRTLSDEPSNAPSPGVPAPAGASPETSLPASVRIASERTPLLESAALYLEGLMSPFATALMVFIMLIFLLLNWEDMRDRTLFLLTDSKNQFTRDALSDAAARVSRFLVTQSVINLCFGVMAALGLWIIHVTIGGRATLGFILAAGLLCGVFRFIPFVGVWIGAIFPLTFIFAAYPSNVVFLDTLAMFLALELFTAQVIEPRWLGASTGISATGIMLSTVFWTWLWGPMGLLVSTPLTTLLVVIGKHLPRFRSLYTLLADRRELDLSLHGKKTSDVTH
jgi:predicted PurR-regulated permease PerM